MSAFKYESHQESLQDNLELRNISNEERGRAVEKRSNRFFYKVSNHHELFKIGQSFYKDYLSGIKSFAITSTGYQTSQQKTILGLASFFDHKEKIKIGIVSDNLELGSFKDIVAISKKLNLPLHSSESSLDIYSFYDHFEFIDLAKLTTLAKSSPSDEPNGIYKQVVDHYDIIFWDVPELHKIQLHNETYFPVIMNYESISIIVAQSVTKTDDVEELKRFFLGYGINLKGLLLEEKMMKKERVKNTPWWKRIFKS